VSKFLAERATVGTVVHLSQAQGDFVLPDHMPEHVVFITGGSGITPAMSMLRSLQKRTHRGRITFLHYSQSPQHQIFAAELADVATTGYGVDLHLLHPELGDPALTPMLLEKLIENFKDVATWACGPAPLIEAVKAAYEGSDALRVEYFQPPKVSGKAGGEVTFANAGTSAENSGETLLVQAENAGLTPAYGCRMGICFSCTARKTDGTVRNILTGETSSLPDEDIRICVSAPEGDCFVDL
jgi:ferredoxin-NADP reductase